MPLRPPIIIDFYLDNKIYAMRCWWECPQKGEVVWLYFNDTKQDEAFEVIGRQFGHERKHDMKNTQHVRIDVRLIGSNT